MAVVLYGSAKSTFKLPRANQQRATLFYNVIIYYKVVISIYNNNYGRLEIALESTQCYKVLNTNKYYYY